MITKEEIETGRRLLDSATKAQEKANDASGTGPSHVAFSRLIDLQNWLVENAATLLDAAEDNSAMIARVEELEARLMRGTTKGATVPHWAVRNPGRADHYKQVAKCAQEALGLPFAGPHEDDNVAPVDVREAIASQRKEINALHSTLNNTCTICWWVDAHDGAGWYYVDDEYPEEGSVGSFLYLSECIQHAMAAGYLVANASDTQLAEGMRVVENASPADLQQAKADAWDEGHRAGVAETHAARRHDGNSEFSLTANPYRKDGES